MAVRAGTGTKSKSAFDKRLADYYDELRWLYMEIYDDETAFGYFLGMLRKSFRERR